MSESVPTTAEGARPVRAPGPGRSDRGAAAAETAAVLPLLLSVVLLGAWLVSLAAIQLRVVDAARETALAAARGESFDRAIAAGARVAPGPVDISIDYFADRVVVEVETEISGPGAFFGFLPLPKAHATTTAMREDQ
ncbi:MAG TPA: TadE family type IV pilus minor pilin [Nocardioidaceae bacterium]|nr:TadE family type IV pilus minor pilin [Nocardioidaceae bacterium]